MIIHFAKKLPDKVSQLINTYSFSYIHVFFFISISFISIPEARFEKKNKHTLHIYKHIAKAQIGQYLKLSIFLL